MFVKTNAWTKTAKLSDCYLFWKQNIMDLVPQHDNCL